jgi:diguanylate cyclase (GGDEF)-like protein
LARAPGAIVRVALIVIVAACCFAPARLGAAELPVTLPVFQMPGAAVAIDAGGTAGIEDAASGRLGFVPAQSFAFPNSVALLRPLVIWVRIPADSRWQSQAFSIETSFDAFDATLWAPRAGGGWNSTAFGMGIPYARRSIARVVPTAQVLATAGGPLYVRLTYSKASRDLAIVNAAAIAVEESAADRQQTIGMFFMGLFVALALTNLVLFSFARSWMYALYSCATLAAALCSGTLGYPFAWKVLWPYWSPPHFLMIVLPGSVAVTSLVFFTSELLNVRSYWASLDRFVRVFAIVAALNGIALALWYVSARVGTLDAADLAMQAVGIPYAILIVAGIRGWRAGNPNAPYVVTGYALQLLGLVLYLGNFGMVGGESRSPIFSAAGLACDAMLLFAALASRLQRMQAEALEQANAIAEQRRLAYTDGLTGVANRRAYDETLAREWERYARGGVPLALIILDIDLFKKYNDTYGHGAGDVCLQRVAAAARECVRRPNDLFARYGGEEFAAILPGADEPAAIAIAQAMCDAVGALHIEHAASTYGSVSISAGVASTASHRFEPTLANAADSALYRAKEGGRNRVESYGSAAVL